MGGDRPQGSLGVSSKGAAGAGVLETRGGWCQITAWPVSWQVTQTPGLGFLICRIKVMDHRVGVWT